MHTGVVLDLREPSDPADLRREVARTAAALPGVGGRPDRRGRTWRADPRFDPLRHLHAVAPEEVDTFLARPLGRSRPLWEIGRVGSPGSRPRLLLKAHHALLDGVAGIGLVARLFGRGLAPGRGPEARRRSRRRARRGLLRALARAWQQTSSTVLNGPSSGRRECVSLSFELDPARPNNLNESLLTALSSALSRWTGIPRRMRLRARFRALCPVSVREPDSTSALGNRISTLLIDLPSDTPDEEHASLEVRRGFREAWRRGQGGGAGALLGGAGTLRLLVLRATMAFFSWRRSFNVLVSCLPSPGRLRAGGAAVERITPFLPLFSGQRLALGGLFHEGRLCVGVTFDPVEPALRELVAEIARSLRRLTGSPGTVSPEAILLSGARS